MPQLYSVDDCESLTTKQVHGLYKDHVNKSQVSLMTSFGFGQELVESAEGVWITQRDGRRVLDFTGGVGVLNHGHNHPRILAARQRFQERRSMEVHKTYFSPYIAALGHNLAELLPGDLNMSFFPNSGAEAVEGAVKLAYKYHGGRRSRVLRADISFHGKLLGSGSLTGQNQSTFQFPGIPGVEIFRYGDLASVTELVTRLRTAKGESDVYAILIEPLSASTMNECSEEFLRGLREICTAENIVLLFDEIYTGWGKTGTLFHFMRYEGLVPDILTTSKSFGGGKSSISAFVAREPIFRKAYDNLTDALLQSTSTTYYGFGEEAVTAIEAVNVAVEDDYPARARAIERILAPGLERIAKEYPDVVAEVRGHGALHGVFLHKGPKVLEVLTKLVPSAMTKDPRFRTKLVTSSVVNALYRDHGVYTYYTLNGDNPLMVAPSLVAEPEEVEYFLACLDETLAQGLPRLLTRFVKEKVSSLW
ncbi:MULTISPECIES: aspartate aminotransferase family protein [unclassified Streptomyces]|uniref:aspartate aminotransferase family protein n=1 Tax=unclassified Streptomyces TaxID=2593676 RepID=UPI001660668C|nr:MULTISPECIES: aminotransferase class III-fold pyridoxal phosphate-dependent enzyme [unclassified Streptomyces]MBD0707448.1 aspartate aminotransferase family protein [Streptomyces sp. CBMA291]MBD0715100.1 aspartate aminotransferase family protein [Streptomyces sp. CBMA370]